MKKDIRVRGLSRLLIGIVLLVSVSSCSKDDGVSDRVSNYSHVDKTYRFEKVRVYREDGIVNTYEFNREGLLRQSVINGSYLTYIMDYSLLSVEISGAFDYQYDNPEALYDEYGISSRVGKFHYEKLEEGLIEALLRSIVDSTDITTFSATDTTLQYKDEYGRVEKYLFNEDKFLIKKESSRGDLTITYEKSE